MLTILLVASPRIIKLHPTALLSVCLSVCHWVHSTGTEDFRARYPAATAEPPSAGMSDSMGIRGIVPHQVLTEFQSLYPNDSQGFRLCPHQILRPSGGPVTGKLNFINFSVTLGLGFNFRWRSCRRLAAAPKGTSRLDVICSYVLYFCNSGVLLLPQPWHSMYSSRLKSFLKKHFYFHTSTFFWNI